MKTNWDLTVFYKDFDDPAFKADLGGLDASIAALTEAVAAPSEDEAAKVLAEHDVLVKVDMGTGDASAKAWGCDLTYDYVKINGDYRT